MPTLTVSEEQVVELVRQLPGESQYRVLLILASDNRSKREARMKEAETQIRYLCSERGFDWDIMSEDEREEFIVDLVHEDRVCAR
jgi:hypothetical protein